MSRGLVKYVSMYICKWLELQKTESTGLRKWDIQFVIFGVHQRSSEMRHQGAIPERMEVGLSQDNRPSTVPPAAVWSNRWKFNHAYYSKENASTKVGLQMSKWPSETVHFCPSGNFYSYLSDGMRTLFERAHSPVHVGLPMSCSLQCQGYSILIAIPWEQMA